MSSQVPAPCAICQKPSQWHENKPMFMQSVQKYVDAPDMVGCDTAGCPVRSMGYVTRYGWDRLMSAISAHTEEKVRLVSRQHGDLRAEERHTYDKWAAERGREEEARTASAVSEATEPLVVILRSCKASAEKDLPIDLIGVNIALAPYLEDGGSSDE